MENVNIILANNIQKYRKISGLTQEELANRLGVTFQAVSKWENERSAPDISLIPKIADIFDCSIDELFSREKKHDSTSSGDITLEWQNDGVIRGVIFEGRKIIDSTAELSNFSFTVNGDAENVSSDCNINLTGNISGKCTAVGDIFITGDVSNICNAGGDITVTGDVNGACCAGNNLEVVGDVASYCNAGNDCIITGDVSGMCCAGRDIINNPPYSDDEDEE